ncbi:MAG: ABC transporter ATP-binding protein [Spirochaetales bacterium]|nr:ABC transporter ATP-binding protein [Spirochaetales bacterium]
MFKEFRTLFPYLKKHLKYYILGFLFLVLTDGGQLVIPMMIRKAVDGIAESNMTLNMIGSLMLKMVGVAAAIAVGRFGWRFFIHGSSRRIEKELRTKLFDHLLKLSSSFYGDMKTGDIMSRFTNDMNAIRMATGMAFVAFVDGVFMTLVILIILFTRYPGLAPYTLIPLPFVFIIVLGAGKLLGQRFLKVQQAFARISDETQEILSGIRVIKTFVRQKHFMGRFEDANDEYLKSNLELVKIWGFLFPVISFLAGLTSLLLLWFGGQQVMSGDLSPGDFVAVMSYLGMLIWPMIGAGFTVNLLNRGAASMGRINQILDTESDILSKPGAEKIDEAGVLEVRNLNYTFPDGETPVLKDISFTVPEGTTLGILGSTGSGKTTLLRLLPRLLDPPEGTIFYGGKDVHEYELSSLRGAMASVPQNTFLFSSPIRDNLAFGLGEADDEYLKEMNRISTIDRDLALFPEGWNTPVGEKGVTLSGGQKQRVAISRALAVDSRFVIFDDALSAVDTETEERILNRFLERRKGRTNIIVSHRVSTLQVADNVIVLEDGRVVQEGAPEALKQEEGIFRRIYQLQEVCRHPGSGGDPAEDSHADSGCGEVPDGE